MKWARRFFLLPLAVLPVADAQIVIDGTADAWYGSPLALQNVATSFGDSNLGMIDRANGSELDAGYARVVSNVLYLCLAGNLEDNYNKLEIFFDCQPGGQGTLRGDNPNVDSDGLNRMGSNGVLPGLTFDNGFEADYWIGVTGGGNPYSLFANYSEILATGGGTGYYLGASGAVTDGILTGPGNNNPHDIRVTINNRNTAGVVGGQTLFGQYGYFISFGSGVSNGVELAVPLAALGNPTGKIKVCAFINATDHEYISNQALDGLLVNYCCPTPPPNVNDVGEPRSADFNNYSTKQWFEVYVDCQPGWFEWQVFSTEAREQPGTNFTGFASLSLVRTGGFCGAATVQYVTRDGTAEAGADYTMRTGTAYFAQDETNESASLYIRADLEPEPVEHFFVTLTNPSYQAGLGTALVATVFIRDDDKDGDGLSDDWEVSWFGTTDLQNASTDFDGDGQSDYDEHCGGSDPVDSNSTWQAQAVRYGGQGVVVSWSAEPARVYQLDRAGAASGQYDQSAGPWTFLEPVTMVYTDLVTEATGQTYRIRIEQGCP